MAVKIYVGDCRDVLCGMEARSVHCCITSPPYWGLRDYGTKPVIWGGDAECEHVWGAWNSELGEREKLISFSGQAKTGTIEQGAKDSTGGNSDGDHMDISTFVDAAFVPETCKCFVQASNEIDTGATETKSSVVVDPPVAVEEATNKTIDESIGNVGPEHNLAFSGNDSERDQLVTQGAAPETPTISNASSFDVFDSDRGLRTDKIPDKIGEALIFTDETNRSVLPDISVCKHQALKISEIDRPGIEIAPHDGVGIDPGVGFPLSVTGRTTEGVPGDSAMPIGAQERSAAMGTRDRDAGVSAIAGTGLAQSSTGSSDNERLATSLTDKSNTHNGVIICQKCGAVKCNLGQEPRPSMFVSHLVEVFREVWRVLRDDGTLWLNLGDSYARNPAKGKKFEGGTFVGSDTNGARTDTRMSVPMGLKEKDLIGIPWRVALALQADGWYLRSAMPWVKCLSGGTRVYARTQKGEMPMTIKDMVRLDPATVKLWDGSKWTQVLGWQETQRPMQPIEIHLRSGERIGCTHEHRFPTQRGLVKAIDLQLGDRVKTCRLPEPKQPRCPKHLPDSLGWFVGMYLAEGSRDSNNFIQISSHIKEIGRFYRLKELATAYGGTCTKYQASENGMCIRIYSPILSTIIDVYLSGRIAKNKHLSMRCWKRSNVFLKGILDGYLEGDGHYDKRNNRWRLGFTKNDNLAADLRTLCGRLGISLRLKRGKSRYDGKPYSLWRGQIRLDHTPNPGPGRFELLPDNEIVKIETSRARKFWDIAVADDPHLFALASGTLTHNSNCMPESVRDRATTAHEYVFLLAKSKRYYYDGEAVRKEHRTPKHLRTDRPETSRYKIGTGNDGNTIMTGGSGFTKHRHHPSGRNRRTSDTFNESLDIRIEQQRAYLAHLEHIRDNGGMLLSEDGGPAALMVNTSGYPGAHFATFPTKLITPMIASGTSERGCCPDCGAGWVRVVERPGMVDRPRRSKNAKCQQTEWQGATSAGQKYQEWRSANPDITLGWRPTCECSGLVIIGDQPTKPTQKKGQSDLDFAAELTIWRARINSWWALWEDLKPLYDAEPVIPCTVLDPFAGSGTTALQADRLGRDAIIIELNEQYATDLAYNRLVGDAPMFADVEVIK